jgi:hypothetical protein
MRNARIGGARTLRVADLPHRRAWSEVDSAQCAIALALHQMIGLASQMAEGVGEVLVLHQGRSYTASYRTEGLVLHVSGEQGWKAARLYQEQPETLAKQLLKEIVTGRR